MSQVNESDNESDIAVIGMAGRFPGARDIDEFWQLLADGREGISVFTKEELLAEGIPAEVVDRPHYVRAKGMLADPDLFDAEFFGYSPRDAAATDPQQRLFLECAWQALEHSGIDPESTSDAIGVYAGSSASTYLTRSLRELGDRPDFMEIVIGNDKDHMPTRAAYKLNLTGPAVCVQTACSTSLVAVHMAGQGLLSGDCRVALAGGASVMFPQREGYSHTSEGIYAQDGHCRAFDADATGTVPGDGVGIVVLKLLVDAIEDGDHVHAVIKGTAVNNDGSVKVGFTAPSIAGQAAVIRAAQRVAGVDPATIGYVEAHGTGTALGDPAELAGLTKAFRAATDQVGFCAVGSVKSAIGHLDAAAGIAGLIKAILAVRNGVIPPSLHVAAANPAMRIDGSPFRISTRTTEWVSTGPRRAGVSSFGVGGTNAHVVLEQAPPPAASGGSPDLLVLSARTATALDRMTDNLADHLVRNQELDLADVAYTTQVGRKSFEYRRFLVCPDGVSAAELARLLTGESGRRPAATRSVRSAPPVAFLFPGQGTQHAGMGAGLYQRYPRFRAEIDRCAALLGDEFGIDLRELLYPAGTAAPDLTETAVAQPALFAVEYALAFLWQEWGVRPRALIGHSIGEYVAACVAGVFSLPDALRLVAHRGRLMQQAGRGAMLTVALPERRLPELPPEVGIAAVNGAELCVVSGPEPGIAKVERELGRAGVSSRRLHTSHAFHSTMMSAAAEQLRELAAQSALRPPTIPFVSNLTGRWITDEQAVDPGYWAQHTTRPVRFADGLTTLAGGNDGSVLLEVGPGQTLSTLARQHVGGEVVPSMRHPRSAIPDPMVLEEAVGRLWSAGVPVDWSRRRHDRRYRVPLPSYPFERQRYQFDQPVTADTADTAAPLWSAGATVHAEHRDGTEYAVAAIWADLLGVPTVGPDDDFFLLGGHSLLGTRLITRMRETFDVRVELRDLFHTPTVAGQARLVEALVPTGSGAGDSPLDREEGEL